MVRRLPLAHSRTYCGVLEVMLLVPWVVLFAILNDRRWRNCGDWLVHWHEIGLSLIAATLSISIEEDILYTHFQWQEWIRIIYEGGEGSQWRATRSSFTSFFHKYFYERKCRSTSLSADLIFNPRPLIIFCKMVVYYCTNFFDLLWVVIEI